MEGLIFPTIIWEEIHRIHSVKLQQFWDGDDYIWGGFRHCAYILHLHIKTIVLSNVELPFTVYYLVATNKSSRVVAVRGLVETTSDNNDIVSTQLSFSYR